MCVGDGGKLDREHPIEPPDFRRAEDRRLLPSMVRQPVPHLRGRHLGVETVGSDILPGNVGNGPLIAIGFGVKDRAHLARGPAFRVVRGAQKQAQFERHVEARQVDIQRHV